MPSFKRPLKLAYFSPLPPEPSGISDYSRELLPYLARWAEVHLYIDDYQLADKEIAWEFPVFNYREFPWRRPLYDYDCTLYHLGNSAVHRYLYPYVSQHPGVVVLHDWVLHHFLAGQALDYGRSGGYVREMSYAMGPAGANLAWEIIAGQRTPPYFEQPLSQRALDASLGVLVHSDYLRGLARAAAPETPVGVVPMGIPLPPDPGPKPQLRQRLGLQANAYVVGSFGVATSYKRIPSVLRAVAQLAAEGIDARYVVVGEVARDLDIARDAAELGIGDRVLVTGYLPEQDFNAYLHAVDVCVNLRFPTAGETSASALRCMAAEQPTLVSNVDANRELPDECVLKIPVGAPEEAMLTRALRTLAAEPLARQALGSAAREYVASHHTLEQAARSYILFLEDLIQRPRPLRVTAAADEQMRPAAGSGNLQEIAGHLRSLSMDAHTLPWLSPVTDAIADLGLWKPQAEKED